MIPFVFSGVDLARARHSRHIPGPAKVSPASVPYNTRLRAFFGHVPDRSIEAELILFRYLLYLFKQCTLPAPQPRGVMPPSVDAFLPGRGLIGIQTYLVQPIRVPFAR